MPEALTPEKIESDARAVGWRAPAELEAEGKTGTFLSAQEYLERGRAIMPFLRRDNEKLTRQLSSQSLALAETQTRLGDALDSIKTLETYHAEMLKEQAKRIRQELVSDLAQANKDGDHEEAARLTAELASHKEPAPPPPKPAERPVQIDYTKDPAFQAWTAANPEFETDLEFAQKANIAGLKVRAENPLIRGAAFYAKLDEELGKKSPPPRSKVDGGTPPASASRSDGKGYSDLPPEAKAKCDEFEKKFSKSIGEGKKYPNKAAWQAKYCADYFRE